MEKNRTISTIKIATLISKHINICALTNVCLIFFNRFEWHISHGTNWKWFVSKFIWRIGTINTQRNSEKILKSSENKNTTKFNRAQDSDAPIKAKSIAIVCSATLYGFFGLSEIKDFNRLHLTLINLVHFFNCHVPNIIRLA